MCYVKQCNLILVIIVIEMLFFNPKGHGLPINDCEDDKMKLFKAPPPTVWYLKGSYPMVSWH